LIKTVKCIFFRANGNPVPAVSWTREGEPVLAGQDRRGGREHPQTNNIYNNNKKKLIVFKTPLNGITVLRQNVASHNVYVTKRNCY
jgi:hypothetical protein